MNLFSATGNTVNYFYRFLGIQYVVDMAVIKYVTNTTENFTSSVSFHVN